MSQKKDTGKKTKTIKEFKIPVDLQKALSARPRALAQWKDVTAVARRDWILWITTAKKAETRTRRIGIACANLAAGKRRVCCFGGYNWLMKTQAEQVKQKIKRK